MTPMPQSPSSSSSSEAERDAFRKHYWHLELNETKDAWGRPVFLHSHVEAAWNGWKARAARATPPSLPIEYERADAAPPNSLPDWDECAMRVANSDFIAKRVAEGGDGPERDSKLATELHRFIYEYDDADPYRSTWFLHRLEKLINEIKTNASLPIDFKQASELLAMFGGEAGEVTLRVTDGHSGKGLYAHYTEYPEEGAEFLGATDGWAVPTGPSPHPEEGALLLGGDHG